MTHRQAHEKAKELVAKMTLEEKVYQMTFRAPAIPRLGIPEYNWWNEGLHGVARAGTATVFPQAIALAAMFDEEYLQKVAGIIATEGRAKHNAYRAQGDRDIYKGLTFWSPNVNIFRDPRWGRGHETYGEDPYLTSRMGVAFVRGLQGDGKYLKLAACAKHFAVHSGPEGLRHEFNAEVSEKDLWETYLPAFEACVKEADVESLMGAYNRTDGEPCCGSHRLLTEILREQWGFQGHVTSDCWAIADFHEHHKVTKNAVESAALAIENGCDLNCGEVFLQAITAVEEGKLKEEDVTRACENLMATRFRLGLFADDCEYDRIPYTENDTEENHAVAVRAAEKSMVLLKNDGILPLCPEKISSVAVIGPNADSRVMLRGNYNGTPSRNVTLLEGIHQLAGDKIRVFYSEGCPLYRDAAEEGLARVNDRLAEAVFTARQADVTLLCLGLDGEFEGEEGCTSNPYGAGDKGDLKLPGHQQELLKAVLDTGKPVVLLLGTGSAVTFGGEEERCRAILNVWYPGALGGLAAARVLFGLACPGGRLPITFYRSEADLPDFTDYRMQGRTYRYMQVPALYPFGFGLTYSRFALSGLTAEKEPDGPAGFAGVTLEMRVENTGAFAEEVTLQAYIRDHDSPFAVPNVSLCGFTHVFLQPGQGEQVRLRVPRDRFESVNEQGQRVLAGRRYTLYFGLTQPDARSIALAGQAPLSVEIAL